MIHGNELRIWQNNIHKNRERNHGVLNDLDMANYTLLMIQEQYWSDFTRSAPLHHGWTLYEPNATDDYKPRTAIYTNNKYLSPAKIAQIPMNTPDAMTIEIQTRGGKTTLIINIYNSNNESTVASIKEQLTQMARNTRYDMIIMGGDFNRHHPLWNPRGYLRIDESSNEIIELAADLDLDLLIPPGTITYPHAGTAIDLVWGNEKAKYNMLKCKIAHKHDHGSDHLPIRTIITTDVEEIKTEPRYNFQQAN